MLVRGSLLSPVAITPMPAEGPFGHAMAGCSRGARNPGWDLSTIYYANQTGDDGLTSIATQGITLQVTNPAIGYQASCLGFLDDSGKPTPTRFSCTG